MRFSGAYLASQHRTHQRRAKGFMGVVEISPSDLARNSGTGDVDDTLPTLDDLCQTTLNPDGGFRSEQMEAQSLPRRRRVAWASDDRPAVTTCLGR